MDVEKPTPLWAALSLGELDWVVQKLYLNMTQRASQRMNQKAAVGSYLQISALTSYLSFIMGCDLEV